MVRTTAAQIRAIIEVDSQVITVDADLDPFIEIAAELVTEKCTGSAGPDPAYTDTRLELIERWLAAHFYAVRDPRTTNEKAGPVGVTYESKTDMGLDFTRYGQQAKTLDTHGGLAALDKATKTGKRRIISLGWLGSESTP